MSFEIKADAYGFAREPEPEKVSRDYAAELVRKLTNDEADARAAADIVLTNRINAEEDAREAADAEIDGKITAEADARASADSTLDGKITAEAEARMSADTELDRKIYEETDTREQEIHNLSVEIIDAQKAIAAAETELNGKIASEAEAREAVYTELNAEILTSSAGAKVRDDMLQDQIDGKVDKVEGKDLSSNDYTDADKRKLDMVEVTEDGIINLKTDKIVTAPAFSAEHVVNAATFNGTAGNDFSFIVNVETNQTLQAALDKKANKQTYEEGFAGGVMSSADKGGAIGYRANTYDGGAVGSCASTTYGGAVGADAKAAFGGAAGSWARAEDGGAVGNNATTTNGGAVGSCASTTYGGAVGADAKAAFGGAVGKGAYTNDGFAGGKDATTLGGTYHTPIDAIQLGTGNNPNPKTLQVYGCQITDTDGNILNDRMPSKADRVKIVDDYAAGALEYNFGEFCNGEARTGNITSLSLVFPDGVYPNDYISGLSFSVGDTASEISYTNTGILNWVGTDCSVSDGLSVFAPKASMQYDIVFYYNGAQFVGLVNGFKPAAGNGVTA